jgi:Family of unknown function (DUF6481)
MASYKDPGFQDRIKLAAEAREKALEKLRNKPPVDEAVIAARKAAAEAKQAAAAEKRAARKQALADEAAAKAAAKAVAKPVPPTPEQQKAARDARYAARKAGR